MKRVYKFLFGLHVFVGIGGLAGGLAAITNPNNPMGMSTEFLKNSPFKNYLIPGIILFVIIGLGNVTCALLFRYKLKLQGYLSSIFSWALVIWIIVQCIMLNSVAALHVIFFVIGAVQAALSMTILFENHQFPTNYVLYFYNKIKK